MNANNSTILPNNLANLKPKNKDPHSVSVLNRWVSLAESEMGLKQSGRLSWLVATTVVTAKLQEVVDGTGNSRFLLKGGTLLQHRLAPTSRATKDLDGIIREDIDSFLEQLDESLEEPWGAISLERSKAEAIETPNKIIKPRRFEMSLLVRGQVWRKIKVEISPDEGMAGTMQEEFPAPSLSGFGLPTPDRLVGISMSYQIAQKIHAATDPHNPPEQINERARDLVDLLLLKQLAEESGSPTLDEIKTAAIDIFEARAKEAKVLGRPIRILPTTITPHSHWKADYDAAAKSAGVSTPMNEVATQVNAWLKSLHLYKVGPYE